MTSQASLFLFSIAYILCLVAIAWRVESGRQSGAKLHSLIYGLTLAVYCSSWTFFGAVGTAVSSAWQFIPIYLGPILLFCFGQGLIKRLVLTGVDHKTTSIADFIGTRYGKRQLLAAFVCLVAVIGSLPYIALQLKAISMAWQTVTGTPTVEGVKGDLGTSLVAAILLAIFAMVFGTRHLRSRERNSGMMAALAIESLVKLFALVAVAFAAIWIVFGTENNAEQVYSGLKHWAYNPIDSHFVTVTILSCLAIMCLPRQFHVMVVEYQQPQDLKTARWLFPVYLLLVSLAVFPIVYAGQLFFSDSAISPDSYVLNIPSLVASPSLAAVAFVGGFSAATGMVVVAVTTLAIMVSNEVVLPLLLRLFGQYQITQTLAYGRYLKSIRRISLAVVMLLAWWMSQSFANAQLAPIGLLSFACFAQLAPAVIGAVLWPRGHAYGVYAGLAVGFGLWLYCLLLPTIGVLPQAIIEHGLFGISWLRPEQMFGVSIESALSHGVLVSLGGNTVLYIAGSLLAKAKPLDKLQAHNFTQREQQPVNPEPSSMLSEVLVGRLRLLLSAFVDEHQVFEIWRKAQIRYRQRLLDDDKAPQFLVEQVERALASIIGASSAHRAMQLLTSVEPWRLRDLADFMGSASAQLRFNQDLLHTSFETLPQGICVVDAELNVVAWNQRYQELFEFPSRLLYVGCPIESLLRYNAQRGMFDDDGDQDSQVERRLELLRSGSDHQFERVLPTGVTIQVVGKLMPHGGFVTTFTDISEYKTMLAALETSKNTLADRVEESTHELRQANEALAAENRLRAEAEQQTSELNASKTRFLQATSHDLLQPISAARLFVAALLQQGDQVDVSRLALQLGQVDKSLAMAEHLIGSLREIARLENRKITAKIEPVDIGDLLQELADEFAVIAEQKGITFHWVRTTQLVMTDRYLLRRILQNFLHNALHYTRRGKVLLGCKRVGNQLRIGVHDTGPGISKAAQQRIFKEFERLDPGSTSSDKGMGLGLTIAQGMADLLGHDLTVDSEPGRGSVFSLWLQRLGRQQASPVLPQSTVPLALRGVKVLCVDNEPAIIEGLVLLLESWGCEANGVYEVTQLTTQLQQAPPDVILLDYHLDEELSGIELHQQLPANWQHIPVIVISADTGDLVKSDVVKAGFYYLSKPVAPAKLQQLLLAATAKHSQSMV